MGLMKGSPSCHMLLITPSASWFSGCPFNKFSMCSSMPPMRSTSTWTFIREPGSPMRRTLVVWLWNILGIITYLVLAKNYAEIFKNIKATPMLTCSHRALGSSDLSFASLCPASWRQTRTRPLDSFQENTGCRRSAGPRGRHGTWSPRIVTTRTRRHCARSAESCQCPESRLAATPHTYSDADQRAWCCSLGCLKMYCMMVLIISSLIN